MSHLRSSATFLSLLLAPLTASPSAAQTADAGTPVVGVHTTGEIKPVLVRDGLGGAYIGYQTVLLANNWYDATIHVIHLRPDATPDPAWTPSEANPIYLFSTEPTHIAPIGSGKVWTVGNGESLPPIQYGSTPDYYMRLVDPTGLTIPSVHAGLGFQFAAQGMQALSQPDGHAMVLYSLGSYYGGPGLFVDRVDANGGLEHRYVSLGFDFQSNDAPVDAAIGGGDGSAMAIVRTSSTAGWDLHAVSLQADGSPVWAPAAKPVATAAGHQVEPSCASDGAGGLFVAWRDDRSTATKPDLYATHLLSDGTLAPGWAVNGKAISANSGEQSHVRTVADGAGGVWLVWTDARSGNLEVYYTHLHADGAPAAGFTISGRPLSGAPGAKRDPLAVSDGMGGLFAVWRDGRNLVDFDLYGQHILPDGSFAQGLAPDGEPICTNPTDQTDLALIDSGSGEAIVAWRDNRTGVDILYAAGVPHGNVDLGVPGQRVARLELTRFGSNPARGAIEWTVSAAEQGEVTVRLVDAMGRVADTRTLSAGVDHAAVRFTPTRPGLYFVIAKQGNETTTGRVAFVR